MATQRKTRRKITQSGGLTTARAIKIAGGSVSSLADSIGITVQAVYKWGKHPPLRRQQQIRSIYERKGA